MVDAEDDNHTFRFRLLFGQPDSVVVSQMAAAVWCAEANAVNMPFDRAQLGQIKTPLRAPELQAGDYDIHFPYRPFAHLFRLCTGTMG